MVKPAVRRKMAEYLRKRYSVGLRRICGRLQMARSTMYYESQGREDEALREALKETAIKRRRWGYRMLSLILGRRGFRDNHKRIYRIYREEGLQVKRRSKRKTAKWRGEKPQSSAGRYSYGACPRRWRSSLQAFLVFGATYTMAAVL